VGGLGRYLVNFFTGVLIGGFRVKELVLDAFFLPSIYRLIPVGTGLILVGVGRGNGVVDGGF
jgi:hypothetical protein